MNDLTVWQKRTDGILPAIRMNIFWCRINENAMKNTFKDLTYKQ